MESGDFFQGSSLADFHPSASLASLVSQCCSAATAQQLDVEQNSVWLSSPEHICASMISPRADAVMQVANQVSADAQPVAVRCYEAMAHPDSRWACSLIVMTKFRGYQVGDGMGGGGNGRLCGAPILAQTLENTAFFHKKMQNRAAPKTAVLITTHPIPHLTPSEKCLGASSLQKLRALQNPYNEVLPAKHLHVGASRNCDLIHQHLTSASGASWCFCGYQRLISRKGFCRNPRGIFRTKSWVNFAGFFWWIFSGLFPWKK